TVGRAFLKQNQYQKSWEVFSYLAQRVEQTNRSYYKVIANLGYSLIGVERYGEAIAALRRVAEMNQGAYLRAWHSLAIAYSYFKIGDMGNYRLWLDRTKARPEFPLNAQFFKDIYPDIASEIDRALEAA